MLAGKVRMHLVELRSMRLREVMILTYEIQLRTKMQLLEFQQFCSIIKRFFFSAFFILQKIILKYD